jgi:phosphoglycolate phosphatase-like HAD superfamily hydrolase
MALRHWKVEDMVSYSICGDEVSKPKPNPDPLLELCRQAQVKPGECIVVGDTISDTGMARQAKALLSVGVLTGSGTTNILTESGAHVVLQSVAQLPQLLTRLGRVRNDEN